MVTARREDLESRIQREVPHLTPAEIATLAELVGRLVAAYEPERVYLFGSVARGDADADSDFDLMLVVPDSASLERKETKIAYRALRGTGTATDTLILTVSQFANRSLARASLPATIVREGKLLYAA